MNKSELIALGIDEEVAKQIMSINGVDIEKAKEKAGQATEKLQTELENSKLEIKSRDEQLANVNSEMEKFKTMDVDSIKNKVAELEGKNKEYETQLTTSKESYEKQLADKDYEFAVKEFTGTQKFTSDFTKNAFIEDFKKQGLKLDNGKFLGAEDYIKGFQEKNQGVFVIETPADETPVPQFTKQQEGQPQDKGSMFNFGFNPLRPMPKE